jgi:hypothetical protein
MIKKIVLLGLGFLPLLLKAQLVLNAQLPTAGFAQKDQLWNLILVHNNEDILDVRIQMDLQDAATGQAVLSASTGNMLIGKGVKSITAKDLQPILYNYNVPELSRNYLPMGTYIACYQVISNGRKEGPLAQECIRFNIDPLSPPLLSSPADRAEIQSPYPQFTWMPPTPYDMFTNLSYDLLVTEVTEGQSATEAIQYNTPIYSKSDITQPYESYASSFTKLDTGKIYAWQVVAKNGLNYAAKTEVWTFKIAPPSWVQQLIEQTPFVKLKRDNPEKGIAPNGILKMSYTNETTDTSVMVHLKEVSATNKEDIVFELKIGRGENLVQKDIQKLLQTRQGVTYEASISNSRREVWRMLFEVRQYKDKKTELE